MHLPHVLPWGVSAYRPDTAHLEYLWKGWTLQLRDPLASEDFRSGEANEKFILKLAGIGTCQVSLSHSTLKEQPALTLALRTSTLRA